MAFRLLTRDQIIERLGEAQRGGWIRSLRPLNSGGIGNTIDALLGLPESNLPIADSAQWEIKTHRVGSTSLLTLFHMEPEPRSERIVANLLLPNYGWPDQHRVDESSFRQTLRAGQPTDRGFKLSVQRADERIVVDFLAEASQPHHREWLDTVANRIGLGPLEPQPFWNFQDLFLKASTKLLNSFYVEAETRRRSGEEYFLISRVHVLQGFEIERFAEALEVGAALVDFDARTHHNHGTKFKLRRDYIPNLYRYSDVVL